MMTDAPIVRAHMVGEAVQIYKDVGPGQIGMDLILPDEDGYGEAVDLVMGGTFPPVREYPPRPSPHHVWDRAVEAWIDPRTPADLAAELAARRANTWKDKSDLLIALAVAGILTPEEAEEAAGGNIPASMQPMLAALPPEAQMAARIKWKSDNLISRNHPVIVAAAYALGVTDEQLDTIFGVTQ